MHTTTTSVLRPKITPTSKQPDSSSAPINGIKSEAKFRNHIFNDFLKAIINFSFSRKFMCCLW